MDPQQTDQRPPQEARSMQRRRVAISICLVVLAAAYTGAVLTGLIPEGRRIDTITLVIIGVTVLASVAILKPDAFKRIKLFELSGFKLEMLEEVKQAQEKQGTQLADINLILPLLLPESERHHLMALANHTTAGYKGGHTVRAELRRLRSIGLIRMHPNREVREMVDDAVFDLADYVELTTLGNRWVSRIREMEKVGNDTL